MPKTFLNVKAVIFDMDGVITHTMPYHYRAWKQVLNKYNIPVTYHDIYLREGKNGFQSIIEILTKYRNSLSKEAALQILSEKENHFKKIVKLRYIKGAPTLLKNLYSQGFKLGLVTGTSKNEVRKILPEKIYSLFSVIISGSDVRRGKPHPEPFLKTIKRLKIDKSDAVVIENAPLGIESAKSAGLICFAIKTSLPGSFLKKADRIFSDLKDMQSKIEFKLKC